MNDSRAVRALTDIVAVKSYAPGMCKVVSWSDEYILDMRGEGCACPDAKHNLESGEHCKHQYAAMLAGYEDAPTPYIDETRERTSPEVCRHTSGQLPCWDCYEGRDVEAKA